MTRSDSSITSGAYGMDDLMNSSDEGDNWIGTMGSTTEPSQRFQGQFVAVGWSDFRSAVEDELKGQIAKSLGILDSKQIYLVDYYIDYLQLGTTMDQTIVNNEMADYREAMAILPSLYSWDGLAKFANEFVDEIYGNTWYKSIMADGSSFRDYDSSGSFDSIRKQDLQGALAHVRERK